MDTLNNTEIEQEKDGMTKVPLLNIPMMSDERWNQLAAEQAKRAEKKENQWIPITERLPKWYTPVLVSTSAGVDINVIAEGRWFLDEEGYEITAWMPLPEPYRPEESK